LPICCWTQPWLLSKRLREGIGRLRSKKYCTSRSKMPCANWFRASAYIVRNSKDITSTWPTNGAVARNNGPSVKRYNPPSILKRRNSVRHARSCSVCWMNSSVGSLPDWKATSSAMAETGNWPKPWDWTRKPWLGAAENCWPERSIPSVFAVLEAGVRGPKKNARHLEPSAPTPPRDHGGRSDGSAQALDG